MLTRCVLNCTQFIRWFINSDSNFCFRVNTLPNAIGAWNMWRDSAVRTERPSLLKIRPQYGRTVDIIYKPNNNSTIKRGFWWNLVQRISLSHCQKLKIHPYENRLCFTGQPEVPAIEEWLVNILPANSRVGIDPFLVQATEFKRLYDYLSTKGHKLVSVQQNLVDLVWKNRPVMKTKPLEILEYRFSGKRAAEKVSDVREAIKKLDAECLIITTLDDIACEDLDLFINASLVEVN